VKDDKVDEFFKDNGIDATKEDIVKMAKEAAVENGELSDNEISKAAGGTGAVSGDVETQLSGAGVSAVRYGGADRYETSARIISSLYGDSIPVLAIATGSDYPDALSGAALAGKAGGAILLVDGSETSNLTDAEQQIIKKSDDVCVLGGTGAVSKQVKSKIDAICLNR
jgi:putative cell wall-binding protein